MHGLDSREVLRNDALKRPAAVTHIAQRTAQNAHVGVGLDKDLDVEQVAQRGILEDQDAFHDHHLARLHQLGPFGALMLRVGVDGTANGLARLQLAEVLHHQIGVKRVGMVVVLLAALLKGAVLTLVVAVMVDDADVVGEMPLQMRSQRGFAGTGAAGDSDEKSAHRAPPSFLFSSENYYKSLLPQKQEKSAAKGKISAKERLTRRKKESIM